MTRLADKLRRRDPVRFYKDIRAYEAGLADVDDHPVLDQLRQRGICVLPQYLPAEDVAAIRAEVEEPLRAMHAGASPIEGLSSAQPHYGTYTLHHVQDRYEACRRFVRDPFILDIVRRYSGGRASSYGAVADWRAVPRRDERVDDWHTDTWRFRFKAMLYLNDVGATNSPMRYLPGSHTGEHWRWWKFVSSYVAHSTGDTALAHQLRARAAAAQAQNPRFEPLTCTGKAGTVLLFDTRGVHRGTTLREGERLILNHTFVDRDDLPRTPE